MRYSAEHKERTRARVLTEAAKAILAKGPHRIGVADVMAKVGLTHGGFYAHFASKDELVVAAIELMFDGALANLRRLTRGKPPAEALHAYIDWYLSAHHRDARETSCPLPALSADLRRLGSPARRRFAHGAAALTDGIAMLLSALGHTDAESLASSALAEMVGALLLARGIVDPKRSDAVLETSRDGLKARLEIPEPSRRESGRRPRK
jgi:TetR/AcrR family transcriptional repressor of nem operon